MGDIKCTEPVVLYGPLKSGKTVTSYTFSKYAPKELKVGAKPVLCKDIVHIPFDTDAHLSPRQFGLQAGLVLNPKAILEEEHDRAVKAGNHPWDIDIFSFVQKLHQKVWAYAKEHPAEQIAVIHDTISMLNRMLLAVADWDPEWQKALSKGGADKRAYWAAIARYHGDYFVAMKAVPTNVMNIFLFQPSLKEDPRQNKNVKPKEIQEHKLKLGDKANVMPEITGSAWKGYAQDPSLEGYIEAVDVPGKPGEVKRVIHTVHSKVRVKNRYAGLLDSQEEPNLRNILMKISKGI